MGTTVLPTKWCPCGCQWASSVTHIWSRRDAGEFRRNALNAGTHHSLNYWSILLKRSSLEWAHERASHSAARFFKVVEGKSVVVWACRGQDARGRQPRNFWVIYHPDCGAISQSREILVIVISLSGLVLTQVCQFHRHHWLQETCPVAATAGESVSAGWRRHERRCPTFEDVLVL